MVMKDSEISKVQCTVLDFQWSRRVTLILSVDSFVLNIYIYIYIYIYICIYRFLIDFCHG